MKNKMLSTFLKTLKASHFSSRKTRHLLLLSFIFPTTYLCLAQSVKYQPAMKPFLAEWKCTEPSVTLHLRIEKISADRVTVKYKAVNHDGINDMAFHQNYDKIEWIGNGFKCSKKGDDPNYDINCLYVDTFIMKGNRIIGTYRAYELVNGKYVETGVFSIGEFYNW